MGYNQLMRALRFQVLLLVVCSPVCKSGFRNQKFHRLAHAAVKCILFGCQESVTAGYYDALHRGAAKLVFNNDTNKHRSCTKQIVNRVCCVVCVGRGVCGCVKILSIRARLFLNVSIAILAMPGLSRGNPE